MWSRLMTCHISMKSSNVNEFSTQSNIGLDAEKQGRVNHQVVLQTLHQKVRSGTNYFGLAPLVDSGVGLVLRFVQWQ